MKTDKELLELAAKACGLLKEYCGGEFTNFGAFLMPTPERPDFSKAGAEAIDEKPVELVKWNPLTDDGDALRLAVKLNIAFAFDVNPSLGDLFAAAGVGLPRGVSERVINGDKEAAARRAIVRVAANLGALK